MRISQADGAELKENNATDRPPKHTEATLLECLQDQRLTSTEWKRLCAAESGVTHGRFFELLKTLEKAGKVRKSPIDQRWEKTWAKSGNYEPYKDQ